MEETVKKSHGLKRPAIRYYLRELSSFSEYYDKQKKMLQRFQGKCKQKLRTRGIGNIFVKNVNPMSDMV